MKLRLLILIIVFVNIEFCSQDSNATNKPVFKKSNLEFNFTQNTASLLTPSLRVIHPGLNGTLSTQWNKNNKLQLRQDFIAGFFYHKSFQSVIQLYSELNFKIKVLDRFYLSPLVMGAGYYMSFLNMQSFYWDGNQYVSRAITMKSNWVISVGSNLEIPTNFKLFEKPLSITAKYRIQVQGVIVRYNVPIIAYSPIMVGFTLPINN
ncbi:MAG: hypothetical protein CL832_04735 [Crocinitomicaceae bacterium]|nr:hypothetical protein [Crocinitomicaceae bacterium]